MSLAELGQIRRRLIDTEKLKQRRDELIVRASKACYSRRRIAAVAGLSHQRISKIIEKRQPGRQK
jgi:hypothetical protein